MSPEGPPANDDQVTRRIPRPEVGSDAPTEAPQGDLAGEDVPVHRRYDPKGVLGRGGQGVVFRVFDRELQRDVALKTLPMAKSSHEALDRLRHEALATARLDHPNIGTIHDVGLLDDGRIFYTMRLVEGESLWHVLERLRQAEILGEEEDPDWTLVRLMQVLQQACLALQYAHERGIVHRDVKPGNIMLGPFGEVQLLDWGISKTTLPGAPRTTGIVQGTRQYMSPEQLMGDRPDGRADVFAMGVVLYECLSLRLPHDDASDAELVAAILRDAPLPPERRTRRVVPPELSALVARAMAKRREERLGSAREFHESLQAFIGGVAERQRRASEAGRLTVAGRELLARHEATEAALADLRARVVVLSREHPPWQPLAEKRPLLHAQRDLERLEARSRDELLRAVNGLTDALAHAPDHAEARSLLADTFLGRLRDAELARDPAMVDVWLSLVTRYHDGRHDRELAGLGSLRVRVHPAHAETVLHRLVEDEIALVDGPGTPLGRGDVDIADLPMGSYALVARAEGFEDARYPIAITRNEAWEGELRLLPTGTLPEGFVYVPGTEAWLGGDAHAPGSWPLRRVRIESFAIQRLPVTFGDWCAFLDSQPPEDASRRIPRTESVGSLCERRDGRFEPAGVTRVLAPWTKESFGDDCAWRIPVMGVCREDADDYCKFMSARLGRTLRLPTSLEWELAARGVDRRAWPWGDRFDATACHCRESSPRQPDLAPVGSAALDVSVYGVRDMGGSMLALTSTQSSEGLLDACGGSWNLPGDHCRSAGRQVATERTRTAHVGFRMVMEIG